MKTAIQSFGSRQFQRVGRWRGNKQSSILGLRRKLYLLSIVLHGNHA